MKPYYILGVRNRTLVDSFGELDSYRQALPGMDAKITKTIMACEGYANATCFNSEDRKKIRKIMEQEIRAGKYTRQFFDAIDKTYKEAVEEIKKFSNKDLSQENASALTSYFQIFYKIYVTTFHPMVLAIYASDLQDLFESELKKLLKNDEQSQDTIIEYTSMLLTPDRLSTVQKEEQMLYDLQNSFENQYPDKTEANFQEFLNQPKTKETLNTIVAGYGWFHMEYIGEPRTTEDYQKQIWIRVQELQKVGLVNSEQKSPEVRLKEIIQKQKDFFSTHEVSAFFKQLVFAMQEFLIVLDFSKADLVEGILYGRPLLNEIGKRVGLPSWVDVRFLLPDEIIEFLKSGKKVDQSYIAERKQKYALVLEENTITSHFGAEAAKVVSEFVEKDEVGQVKEFRGKTAYPGKVRGRACIVTSAADRNKFEKGNILVTRDTTTELTAVIKNSIAIVADQGTFLSHTSIVAREFKIPCVIQTKIGTKLLKDGDDIEVDATNGVITILS